MVDLADFEERGGVDEGHACAEMHLTEREKPKHNREGAKHRACDMASKMFGT